MDYVLKSVAQHKIDEYYREEYKINEQFNVFVTNYQIAYEGPNTLKGQIDIRVKNANKRCKFMYCLEIITESLNFFV